MPEHTCQSMDAPSLNDLVGSHQHRRRDRQAEKLGRSQVEDELEAGGLLNRKVFRLGPLEELVDVTRGIPELIKNARAEAHENTRVCELPEFGSYRQPVPLAELDDPCSIGDLDGVLRRHEGLGAKLHRGLEALLEITRGAQLELVELYSEQRCGRLDLLQLLEDAGIGGTPQDRHPGERREGVLQ